VLLRLLDAVTPHDCGLDDLVLPPNHIMLEALEEGFLSFN
jgi:hypothetical protein